MALKGRRVFRDALLAKTPANEWPKTRIRHQKFYAAKFKFEGKELKGKQLVKEYAERFPYDKTHSLMAEVNRMLSECGIQQLSFLSPWMLRGLLLSSMSEEQWKRYRPSRDDFRKREFCWIGVRLRGQMLLNNVRMELLNQMNGTYYAYTDYQKGQPYLPLVPHTDPRVSDSSLIKEILSRAEIEVACPLRISDATLSKETLRSILLSLKSRDDWKRVDGSSIRFSKMRFEPEGYDPFSGDSLMDRYKAAVPSWICSGKPAWK